MSTQLYDFNYSYLIVLICTQLYGFCALDGTLTGTMTLGQTGHGNRWQQRADSTLFRAPELKPHHWM